MLFESMAFEMTANIRESCNFSIRLDMDEWRIPILFEFVGRTMAIKKMKYNNYKYIQKGTGHQIIGFVKRKKVE